MLDVFLNTVYRHEAEKTASAALEEKLRTMPADLVEKIAFGGISATKCGDSPEAKCWLDNFKGTPLFEKAVELERAEIQLEQQDIEQRMQQQTQDSWTKRDALRLQKKMLELDLALEGAGAPAAAVAPEAAEDAAIGTLEQVQAEEAAAGEGNTPEEQMENDAIAELHAAHGEGAASPGPPAPKAPPAAKAAPPKPPEAKKPPPGPSTAGAGPSPFPLKEQPKQPAKKESPKEGAPPAEDEKQASFYRDLAGQAKNLGKDVGKTLIHEHPGATHAVAGTAGFGVGAALGNRGRAKDEKQAALKVAAADAAGRLLAKVAEPPPPKGMSVKDWDKALQKKAAEDPEGHHLRRALLSTPVSAAIEAEPGSKGTAFGNTVLHGVGEQLKGFGKGAVGGGVLGGAAGAIHGGLTGGASKALSQGLAGAGAGALLGGYGGATYGALKGQHGAEASRLHGEHSKHRPEAVARARSARDADVVAEQEGMTPEQTVNEAQGLRESADDIDASPGKYRVRRALLGGAAGAAAGGALGGAYGGKAGLGALIGAGAGGLMSALPRPSGEGFRGDASALEGHLAQRKVAGINVGGLVGAAKAAVPQIAGVANAGKNMLGTAMKAGGLPQVAKSVGNVASGFAKANPLAAAGAAGAAGLAAGRLSKSNAPRAQG